MNEDCDDFVDRLARVHEEIVYGPATLSLDTSASNVAAGRDTDPDLSDFAECLALIDRVRRREAPPPLKIEGNAIGETVARPVNDSEDPWVHGRPGPFGQRRIGRFIVLRELGHGGVGVVFLAMDPALNRPVALKIPLPHVLVAPTFHDRFLREGEAAARLSHPNIVAVHEVGRDGPIGYIASEYCPGTTLARWARSQAPPMDPRVAAAIVERLADAVAHAHAHAVLHRDIKPSNVLVLDGTPESSNDVPHVKLADFGLAKLLDEDADSTRTGDLIGTPAYMSPEQAAGKARDVDVTTDVYSLGAVLFELLTGRPPFLGETRAEVVRRVVEGDPPRVDRLREGAPRDLAVIVAKCLAKAKTERYATARELAYDLQQFLTGGVIRARPVGPIERWWKWVRRRPTLAAASSLAIAFPIIILVLSLVFNARLLERELGLWNRLYVSQTRKAYELIRNGQTKDAEAALADVVSSGGQSDLLGWPWHHLNYLALRDRPIEWRCHDKDMYSTDFSPDGRFFVTASRDGTAVVWEWATKNRKGTLKGHVGDINVALFSPDGAMIATCGDDGTVRLWEASTARPLHVLRQHQGVVECLAFHPDGKNLASGGRDARICVWDVQTGSLDAEKILDTGHVLAVAFAPEGDMLLASSRHKSLTAWDRRLQTVKWSRSDSNALVQDAYAITFDRFRKRVVTALGSGKIGVLRLADGRHEFDLDVGRDRMTSVCCLADGSLVAAAGLDGGVAIWNMESRAAEVRIGGGRARVYSITRNHSTDEIAWADSEGVVRIVKSNASRSAAFTHLARLDGAVRAFRWSPDKRTLFALAEGELVVFDPATNRVVRRLPQMERALGMDLSPSGQRIVVCERRGRVRVWNAQSFELLAKLPSSLGEGLDDSSVRRGVAFLGDDSRIAVSAGPDGDRLVAWNLDDSKTEAFAIAASEIRSLLCVRKDVLAVGTNGVVQLFRCRQNSVEPIGEARPFAKVGAMAVHDDRLVVGDSDGVVSFLTVPSLAPHTPPETVLSGGVDDILVDAIHQRVAVVGSTIALLDRETAQVLRRIPVGPDEGSVTTVIDCPQSDAYYVGFENGVIGRVDPAAPTGDETLLGPALFDWLAISPDGAAVCCRSRKNDVCIVDTASASVRDLREIAPFTAIACVHGGKDLAVGQDGSIVLCRAKDLRVLREYPWNVSVAYRLVPLARDLLAVQGEDQSVHVLDLNTGRIEPLFADSKEGITSLAASTDGNRLAVARADRSLKVWMLPDGRNLRTFGDGSIVYTALAYLPDGKTLAAGTDHGSIQLWDVASAKLKDEIALPRNRRTTGLSISPDRRTMAIADGSSDVQLWDLVTREFVFDLESGKPETTFDRVEFSSDGRLLVAGGTRNGYMFVQSFRTSAN